MDICPRTKILPSRSIQDSKKSVYIYSKLYLSLSVNTIGTHRDPHSNPQSPRFRIIRPNEKKPVYFQVWVSILYTAS